MRILILSSGTGGGHNARARAFKNWAAKLTPWEVDIFQALEDTHAVYRFGVNFYNYIQRTFPLLHHGYFNFLELVGLHRTSGLMLGRKKYVSVLRDFRPDVIVSTHAHLNHAFFDIARRELGRDSVRCVTYCGELAGGYGFSRHWVNPGVDLFIGSVEDTIDTAIRHGIDKDKTVTGGFLLDPEFYDNSYTAEECNQFVREELGLDPDEFILLLAASAAGANNHIRLLDALRKHHTTVQVIVLCGHSPEMLSRVLQWKDTQSTIKISAIPYTSDMGLLLRSVSAVVARPGSATASEAVLCACPIIFNGIGGIMPQELLTLRFARKHEFCSLIQRPDDLAEMINDLQNNPAKLETLSSRMKLARPAGHPSEILKSAVGESTSPAKIA